MDWAAVIDRNRDLLLRLVAALVAMVGVGDAPGPDAKIPRHRLNAVRRILRSAESAARRLVVIAASRMAVILPPVGVFMYGLDPLARRGRRPARRGGDGAAARIATFALIDPVKRFSRERRARRKGFPRITFAHMSAPTPIPDGWFRLPDDEVDAGPLCRRLAALRRALEDIDGQARRLVRWQARHDGSAPASRASPAGATGLPRSPLRTGRPPGHRKRAVHEVDALLSDLNSLARCALSPDTS